MNEQTRKSELTAMTKDELTAYMTSNDIELLPKFQAPGSAPVKQQLVQSILVHEGLAEQAESETAVAAARTRNACIRRAERSFRCASITGMIVVFPTS